MSENYTLINWQNGEITQPAVVEIDGVDYQVQPAIETGNTPINADNLNHMDNGIRNATLKLNDKIETATVQLIAVTDTAPSECAENDKYYNTNTNLIYTATGTDTWGVTGETPSQLYLYMDISDEKLYYYDGNTFSSYGGGSGGTGGETLPIGSIMLYSGNTLPVNWLLCNGQAVSRAKYSALFEKIGTTYGSGDGSTTFNVPNLKGKVAVGKDDNDTDFDTLGETGGEKTHTLTENEMPSHYHDENYGSARWIDSGGLGEQGSGNKVSYGGGGSDKINITANTGGGQPHNNLQPYIVQNFIIKAEQAPGTATLAEVLPVGSQINFDGEVSDIPTGWEQVDDPNEYSTTETIVGTYMNKPLYRKVVEIGSLPNNTTQTYNHNISNMDMLTYYDLIWYDTADNRFFKAPRIDTLEVFVKCQINTINIQIEAKGLNWSNRTQNSKVILEYTKTTD